MNDAKEGMRARTKVPFPQVGDQHGERTITEIVEVGQSATECVVAWRCSCGMEGKSWLNTLRIANGCKHRVRMSKTTEPLPLGVRGPLSLEEIAQLLGVSRERVRQIEEQALRKCAKWFRARGITAGEVFR